MASQETADAWLDELCFVVRQTQKKPNGTWIGASVFYPESLRKNKVLALLNPNIVNILKTSSGNIKPGNLIQIKNQEYKVQFVSDNKTIYNLDLMQNDIAFSLEMLYLADPFNYNDNKSICFIKNSKSSQPFESAEKDIINKYLNFNDHIDYCKTSQKKTQKTAKNRKRKYNEMDDIKHCENDGPAMKSRKLMESTHDCIDDEFEAKDITNCINNAESNQVKTKESDKEEMDDGEQSEEIERDEEIEKEIENEIELRRKHLYIPSEIVSNPDRLLRFEGDNVVRMIYDSEEEIEGIQQETHDYDNDEELIENVSCRFGKILLDSLDKQQYDAQWIISKCANYWIPNDVSI